MNYLELLRRTEALAAATQPNAVLIALLDAATYANYAAASAVSQCHAGHWELTYRHECASLPIDCSAVRQNQTGCHAAIHRRSSQANSPSTGICAWHNSRTANSHLLYTARRSIQRGTDCGNQRACAHCDFGAATNGAACSHGASAAKPDAHGLR